MSVFDWLVIGHLAGDFLLQTDNMAKNKPQQWLWLLCHVGLYMVGITLIVGVYTWTHGVPLWLAVASLLFVFATHLLLDRRNFTVRWMRLVGMSGEQPWLFIVVDQIFHIFTLALVAQALAWAGD